MVYRIQPKSAGRLKFFLRLWCFYASLIVLGGYILDALENNLSSEFDGQRFIVCLLLAAGGALLSLRAWARIGWFTPAPRDVFLTVLDEGLLTEVPGKGWSLFLPWAGLAYHKRGEMLLISSHGALRSIVSLNGLSSARVQAILSDLRAHTGQASPRRGMFAAERVSGAFAAAARQKTPAAPAALVPPPGPVTASVPALYTNTSRQWSAARSYIMRPDWLLCTVYVAAIAVLSVFAGLLAWGEDWSSAVFMVLFAVFLTAKLSSPGNRRQRSVPGSIRMELTATEIYEYWEDGSWARFRLPAVEKSRLVRLPNVWCLREEKSAGMFMLDVDAPLPPQLAPYRREEAPGNGLRAILAVLVLFFGCLLGYYVVELPDDDTVVAQDFRAMLQQADEEALRAFAENHFTTGALYDTPRLEPLLHADGQEVAGYSLSFTEGAPDDEEDMSHFGYVTRVNFAPDGEIKDYSSRPVEWCPCLYCFSERLEP